jgi:hypothetical protein
MKKILYVGVTAALTLLLTIPAYCGNHGKIKQLGIATYSVKGLESDIEVPSKPWQKMAIRLWRFQYDANSGMVAGYKPADYAALATNTA